MIPNIVSLRLPKIIDAAQRLPSKGNTQTTANNLFFLNTDDAYIHQLFPLLEDERVKKPDYFGEKSVGAHITIIYPEESKNINVDDLQQEHSFFIKDIVTAEVGLKTYYVLLIESPSLLKLRKKYDLPDLLSFKGYLIEFHITIGVKI
jgi:2H phosphodiesterase-like protein